MSAGAEAPASIGDKFAKTLDALTRIDPIFSNWEVMDYPAVRSVPLETARSSIAAMIEENVKRDDWRRPQPDEGYTARAFTDTTNDSRRMDLTINAGGEKTKETPGSRLEIFTNRLPIQQS